jgi:hypothetical protein
LASVFGSRGYQSVASVPWAWMATSLRTFSVVKGGASGKVRSSSWPWAKFLMPSEIGLPELEMNSQLSVAAAPQAPTGLETATLAAPGE